MVVGDEHLQPLPSVDHDLFLELVRKYQLSVNNLTERQLAESIRQAIASGDFTRFVVAGGSQCVSYIPFREVDQLKRLYNELIYAVATKHEGETRHETALRYIQERESQKSDECSASPP